MINKKNTTKFQEKIYKILKKVPSGKVTTYGILAKQAGVPKASRAVGNALNVNPYAPDVPCHRVVRSDGTIGGFASGTKNKTRILKTEGILIKNGKVIDFNNFLYKF